MRCEKKEREDQMKEKQMLMRRILQRTRTIGGMKKAEKRRGGWLSEGELREKMNWERRDK